MITNIAITNFKSIANLPDLQLGQINFLIGKNGVGKSNLISAIELTRRLCKGERFERAASQIAPFGIELFTSGGNSSEASITLGVRSKDSSRYELSYNIGLSNGEFTITNEKLSVIEKDSKLDVYIRKGDSFTARKHINEPLTDSPLVVKGDELVLASFNNEIALKVASLISNFKVLWFDKAADPYVFKPHRQDSLDVSNLDGLVISLHENNRGAFDKAVSVIKQIIPEFVPPRINKLSPPATKTSKSEEEAKVFDRYFVFWGEKATQELEYTLTGLSDGNFRIIQLVFALFDSDSSACLIGEEIENGQHYGRIKTLMEVLKHLSIKLNVQLLFSTHSLELLSHVSPDDVIFTSKNAEGYSSYQKLSAAVDRSMVEEELGHEPTAKELVDLGMI